MRDNNNYNQNNEKFQLNETFHKEAIEDLSKSGLEIDIIQEAHITPATETELEKYKIHYWDKNKRQYRFRPLYIIPYLKTYTDEGKFCRVKVKPDPLYPDFDGKYTQPPKQELDNSCHLYILPSELEKFTSPRCKLAIVEGEKKTLKLIQEIRKLEAENKIDYKIAVIGISGVNNWQEAPEWRLIKLLGKEVILFFDADSEHNVNVVKAELELAGFLYSKGAGVVKSANWGISEGKGIDDFLVNAQDKALDKLIDLLDNRISPFQKYKKKLQNKELLRAIFKYPIRSEERLDYVIETVKDEARVKARTIKAVVSSLKIEYEEELKEKLDKKIRETFGTSDFTIPSNFFWSKGFLTDQKGNILTKIFIVKERIINENDNQVGIVLKFANKKEIYIPVEHLNKKYLTLIFNQNSIPMDEQIANKVLNYITLFQIKFVYDFENGKGRTRANVNLKVREALEYRGILSITSEDALNTLLEQADKTVKGVLRRVVIVDYSEFSNVDKEIFSKIYETINFHYGNLITDWIEEIKSELSGIEALYHYWKSKILDKFNFNGQERHLALLFTSADLLTSSYSLQSEEIFNILWKIAEHNYNLFAEAVEITKERLINKLNEFIEQNMANFFNPSLSPSNPRILYGKIDEEEISRTVEEIEKKTIVYLTTTGIKEFAKYVAIPQKELLRLLVDYGFLEKGNDRIAKRTSISFGQMIIKAYKIDTKQTIKVSNLDKKSSNQDQEQGISF